MVCNSDSYYWNFKNYKAIYAFVRVFTFSWWPALNHYNAIAPLMDPPAPHLEWQQLVDYTFISEFELLKHSSSFRDITAEPWAVPGNCEMTMKHFKLIGAHTEIHRCNYEAWQLHTSIQDEQQMYVTHIACVHLSNPDLASEIQWQADTQTQINAYILVQLNAVESLTGFSGVCGCGVCCGEMEVDDAEGGSPSHGTWKAIKRAWVSVVEETAVEGLVGDGIVSMDDGDGDLRDWLIDFSEAVTQESPSTNSDWTLCYLLGSSDIS